MLFVPGRVTVSVKSLGRMMDICAVYVSIDKDKDSEDADDDDNGFVKDDYDDSLCVQFMSEHRQGWCRG